jgi:Na+-transporting NADH:ubiquinone oxidoreductase subunit C
MKNFSNLYIFLLSSALVLVVAAVLSFTSLKLKPLQDRNVEIERQRNILSALRIESTVENAESLYRQHIRESLVVKTDGNTVPGKTAESINLKQEMGKDDKDRELPVYVAEKDGQSFVVIPVWGAGLWGPIWGNIALESDMNTVYGVNFDHAGETPGLGAEINTPAFQRQFADKKLFDNSTFVSVRIKKAGSYTSNEHTVDAISGGTLTSDGVDEMIRRGLSSYQTYFSQHKSK